MTSQYQAGASDVEVRVCLAIPPSRALSHETWTSLQDDNPEFAEAVKYGRLLSEAWWDALGRKGVTMGKRFNTPLWIVQMRNRFGFKGADRALPGPGGSNPDPEKDEVTIYLPANGR
ncbi:hypothetical protein ABIB06_006561 [Bradyrhizobium sp. LB8.2]|uniref:hypothetical protein n=1 Tax=unclassified Bradyrhizobium TaxID=2631580 RepID=UPI00339B4B2B